jgi:tRNA(Ile)-lysidine synthase
MGIADRQLVSNASFPKNLESSVSQDDLLQRLGAAWPAPLALRSKTVLAISGGPDSMFLLEVFRRFIEDSNLLTVVHCNHRQRGEESDADEAFVRQQCESKNIAVRIFRFDEEQASKSDENHLRKHRHECLKIAARECDANFIALGHHLDDNLETLFHRLLRGTGARGLCGISPTRDYIDQQDSKTRSLIRPLLTITKEEIVAWLYANDIPFRMDSSNEQLAYTRNRLRLELFPLLDSLAGVTWREKVAGTIEQLKDLVEEDRQLANELLADTRLEWIDGTSLRIPILLLHPIRWSIQREFFVEVWHRLDLPLREMSMGHWRRVRVFLVEAAKTNHPKRLQCAGSVMLQTSRGMLSIAKKLPPISNPS